MDQLDSFIKSFTQEEIPEARHAQKIGRQFFYVADEAKRTMKQIKIDPYSAGLFLGEEKDRRFKPGFPLLDLISKRTERKVVVNKKGETMFLYGKNILEESIMKKGPECDSGLVLVQNEDDETLGYGEAKIDKGTRIIKNLLDRGDFLRREN
jgi:60S ribosome subunit biogenesis protein NIP7